eukprot:GHVS01049221.1.p1 GENE.GHVS01049221.1~~GHVS01049221.1.p1  ORF type:complete len:1236 (+),score=201.75 GHVS01049221.1:127-3834(+)
MENYLVSLLVIIWGHLLIVHSNAHHNTTTIVMKASRVSTNNNRSSSGSIANETSASNTDRLCVLTSRLIVRGYHSSLSSYLLYLLLRWPTEAINLVRYILFSLVSYAPPSMSSSSFSETCASSFTCSIFLHLQPFVYLATSSPPLPPPPRTWLPSASDSTSDSDSTSESDSTSDLPSSASPVVLCVHGPEVVELLIGLVYPHLLLGCWRQKDHCSCSVVSQLGHQVYEQVQQVLAQVVVSHVCGDGGRKTSLSLPLSLLLVDLLFVKSDTLNMLRRNKQSCLPPPPQQTDQIASSSFLDHEESPHVLLFPPPSSSTPPGFSTIALRFISSLCFCWSHHSYHNNTHVPILLCRALRHIASLQVRLLSLISASSSTVEASPTMLQLVDLSASVSNLFSSQHFTNSSQCLSEMINGVHHRLGAADPACLLSCMAVAEELFNHVLSTGNKSPVQHEGSASKNKQCAGRKLANTAADIGGAQLRFQQLHRYRKRLQKTGGRGDIEEMECMWLLYVQQSFRVRPRRSLGILARAPSSVHIPPSFAPDGYGSDSEEAIVSVYRRVCRHIADTRSVYCFPPIIPHSSPYRSFSSSPSEQDAIVGVLLYIHLLLQRGIDSDTTTSTAALPPSLYSPVNKNIDCLTTTPAAGLTNFAVHNFGAVNSTAAAHTTVHTANEEAQSSSACHSTSCKLQLSNVAPTAGPPTSACDAPLALSPHPLSAPRGGGRNYGPPLPYVRHLYELLERSRGGGTDTVKSSSLSAANTSSSTLTEMPDGKQPVKQPANVDKERDSLRVLLYIPDVLYVQHYPPEEKPDPDLVLLAVPCIKQLLVLQKPATFDSAMPTLLRQYHVYSSSFCSTGDASHTSLLSTSSSPEFGSLVLFAISSFLLCVPTIVIPALATELIAAEWLLGQRLTMLAALQQAADRMGRTDFYFDHPVHTKRYECVRTLQTRSAWGRGPTFPRQPDVNDGQNYLNLMEKYGHVFMNSLLSILSPPTHSSLHIHNPTPSVRSLALYRPSTMATRLRSLSCHSDPQKFCLPTQVLPTRMQSLQLQEALSLHSRLFSEPLMVGSVLHTLSSVLLPISRAHHHHARRPHFGCPSAAAAAVDRVGRSAPRTGGGVASSAEFQAVEFWVLSSRAWLCGWENADKAEQAHCECASGGERVVALGAADWNFVRRCVLVGFTRLLDLEGEMFVTTIQRVDKELFRSEAGLVRWLVQAYERCADAGCRGLASWMLKKWQNKTLH